MSPLTQRATQRFEETHEEASTRKQQNFGQVESSLKATDSGLTKPSDSSLTASTPTGSASWLTRFLHSLRSCLPPLSLQLFDNFSSYMGHSNPLANPVHHQKDTVWLLDNAAFQRIYDDGGEVKKEWHAEFIACYFARDSGKDVSRWVADIADKVGLHDMEIPDDLGVERIKERVRPFLQGVRPARWVDVILEGEKGHVRRLGPGGRTAVSTQIVGPLGREGDFENGEVALTKPVKEGICPLGGMRTFFVEPEGWLVVSDIDDTIKVTQTPDPIGILRTTFVSTPETTPGMPELYSTLRSILQQPAFFYLSASPYNLYPFLTPFLHTHYPAGTLLLREASWVNISGLLQTLTQGVQAFKVSRLEKLHHWFPQRRVLCVGDSTQSDPEAYAEVYKKYPGWIKGIFIRKVTGIGGMEDKNEDERFEKAFEEVPRSVWRVFEDPKELQQAVESLKTL